MSAPTRTRPRAGAELELTVTDLAYGGRGVARAEEGFVVFVPDAVPGDRVRVRLTKAKRSFAEARTVELLEPSPERIAPLAEHPGAPWQVLPYERQLEVKHAQVDDALRRIGKLDGFELEPIVPAVEQWRYRNKLEYSFGEDESGSLVCGFHAPGSWHEIVPVEDCLLASEAGNAVREQVVAWCRAEGLSVHDRRDGSGLLRNLVVREGRRTGQVTARLVTAPGQIRGDALAAAVEGHPGRSPRVGVMWSQVESLGERTYGGDTEILAGEPWLEEELGGLRFRISPEAFFQTNTEMAERLYGVALDYASLRGHERVFDLYSGSARSR